MTTTDDLIARAQAVLDELPTCDHCGKRDAVCLGRYEDAEADEHACGECCGHGNEDGHCAPIGMPHDAPAVIRDLIARLADQAPGLTVGAALADPRVQAGTHVVEYNDEGAGWLWRQLRSGKRESLSTRAFIQGFRGSPPERTMAWLAWMSTSVDNLDGAEVWIEEYARPCRLVSLADADRDPAERGPL